MMRHEFLRGVGFLSLSSHHVHGTEWAPSQSSGYIRRDTARRFQDDLTVGPAIGKCVELLLALGFRVELLLLLLLLLGVELLVLGVVGGLSMLQALLVDELLVRIDDVVDVRVVVWLMVMVKIVIVVVVVVL